MLHPRPSSPRDHTRPILYRNARIFTATHKTPWADALIVAGDRLLAVGTEKHIRQSAGSNLEIIDLAGRFVMPGMCDSHIHLYDTILAARNVQLAGCENLAAMQARIAAHNATTHEEWLCGQGWNESRWPVPQYPTANDLAQVTDRKRPAIFWRSDMHVAVCNQAALERSQITAATIDPPGGRIGRDSQGQPNGLLYDTAINLASQSIPPLTGPALEAAMRAMISKLHSLGITAIHDQRLQTGSDGPRMLTAYTNLHRRGELNLRVHCNIGGAYLEHALALGLQSGFGDEWLRIGHVKYFIDGSLGSGTAWMLAPYAGDAPTQHDALGICVTPPEQLRHDFLRAMQAGLAISVHAIGDRGNREVLDLFEELLPQAPPPKIPHRIEHAQILAPKDIPRFGQMNLTASVQPSHALDDIEIAGSMLGARGAWTYAFRSLAQGGARLAFGSDAPVADYNPLLGIHAAVQRSRPATLFHPDKRTTWHPEQRIDLADALQAYTIGPAQAVGADNFCGTLESGKYADFVVLGADPFSLYESRQESANFVEIPVEMTVIGGEVVYQSESPMR
jgi:predicted amidohydrolase YtcJ